MTFISKFPQNTGKFRYQSKSKNPPIILCFGWKFPTTGNFAILFYFHSFIPSFIHSSSHQNVKWEFHRWSSISSSSHLSFSSQSLHSNPSTKNDRHSRVDFVSFLDGHWVLCFNYPINLCIKLFRSLFISRDLLGSFSLLVGVLAGRPETLLALSSLCCIHHWILSGSDNLSPLHTDDGFAFVLCGSLHLSNWWG